MLPGSIFDNANCKLEHVQRFPTVKAIGIGSTPYKTIYRENKVRLRLYEPTTPSEKPVVLLIPSLINRPYILDLMPERSLVKHFLNEGRQVALLDWGTPGDEDRFVPLERYLNGYIARALRALEKIAGAKTPSVVGQCLGGTFALLFERMHPGSFKSIIALTAPVDFDHDGLLSKWSRSKAFSAKLISAAHGNAPWFLMQSAFQLLKPSLQVSKFIAIIKRGHDEDFMKSSLALETWANDNVAFPGQCFEDFIEKIARGDGMLKSFALTPKIDVEFSKVKLPILNVMADGDHIVPVKSSMALRDIQDHLGYRELNVKGGHIGAIVGKRAPRDLWPKLSEFLNDCENGADQPGRDRRSAATLAQ